MTTLRINMQQHNSVLRPNLHDMYFHIDGPIRRDRSSARAYNRPRNLAQGYHCRPYGESGPYDGCGFTNCACCGVLDCCDSCEFFGVFGGSNLCASCGEAHEPFWMNQTASPTPIAAKGRNCFHQDPASPLPVANAVEPGVSLDHSKSPCTDRPIKQVAGEGMGVPTSRTARSHWWFQTILCKV